VARCSDGCLGEVVVERRTTARALRSYRRTLVGDDRYTNVANLDANGRDCVAQMSDIDAQSPEHLARQALDVEYAEENMGSGRFWLSLFA
jgi:hypothetical protein